MGYPRQYAKRSLLARSPGSARSVPLKKPPSQPPTRCPPLCPHPLAVAFVVLAVLVSTIVVLPGVFPAQVDWIRNHVPIRTLWAVWSIFTTCVTGWTMYASFFGFKHATEEVEGFVEEVEDILDVSPQVRKRARWALQKLPELVELRESDIHLARAVGTIVSIHSGVEHIFLPLEDLLSIHPINRATAEEKRQKRAECLRNAEGVIRAAGMRFSEALVSREGRLSAMDSITGMQVVRVGDHWILFEGNGRVAALHDVFDGAGLQVEVRRFLIPTEDQATMERRVVRAMKSNGMWEELGL